MQPEQILPNVKAVSDNIRSNISMPELCSLKIEQFTEDGITDTSELVRKIKEEFNPDSGWLTLQSEVVTFQKGEFPDLNDQELINGEMVDRKGRKSLHVREITNKKWSVTVFCEIDDQPATSLVENVSFLGHKQANQYTHYSRLTYRRYWQLKENFGYFIKAARFTGFKEEV